MKEMNEIKTIELADIIINPVEYSKSHFEITKKEYMEFLEKEIKSKIKEINEPNTTNNSRTDSLSD